MPELRIIGNALEFNGQIIAQPLPARLCSELQDYLDDCQLWQDEKTKLKEKLQSLYEKAGQLEKGVDDLIGELEE